MKEPLEFLSGKTKSPNLTANKARGLKKSAARVSRANKLKRFAGVNETKTATQQKIAEQIFPKHARSQTNTLKYLQLGASISLLALIFLCLAWETILAPLKPQGSWLMLKAVFLCLPLLGILKGRRYTYQWACMFILFYFIEGCVRAWADVGISAQLALAEVLLTTIFFFSTIYYAKLSANLAHKPANT